MPDPEKTPEPAPVGPPSAGWLSLTQAAVRAAASLFRPEPTPGLAGNPALPRVVSPDTLRERRVPPRQVTTRKWPVLHAGPTPTVDLAAWTFRVFGLVDEPKSWTWAEFRKLPAVTVAADMHCVTRWSRLDNAWEGVLVREVFRHVTPRPGARFALIHAEGGFTTNLPLDALLGDDCLLAWAHDGRALDPAHGWPLRLVIPRLYAWKSAKWATGIEILDADRPGFWETNGYHNDGDPWLEQRHGPRPAGPRPGITRR